MLLPNAGSADFLAVDLYYSTWISAPDNGIAACLEDPTDPNWPACYVARQYDAATGWPVGIAGELFAATPQNVRHDLKEIHTRWPSPKIVSTLFVLRKVFH